MRVNSPFLALGERFGLEGAVCEIAGISATGYFVRSKRPGHRPSVRSHPHAVVESWHRTWQAACLDPNPNPGESHG